MVFEAIRLQFHLMTYTRKDEHKSRYFVKKRSSKYKRRQQRCLTTQGRTMDKKNNSRSNYVEKNYNNKQIRNSERNQEE